MQDGFTSPDGFVCVSYPDKLVPRPRMPQVAERTQFIALLPDTDIKMGWLGNYPSLQSRRRPVHPGWIGTDTGSTVTAAAAPTSWFPTLLDYLGLPRLHRTFPSYKGDPLSGDMMAVAQRMAWDPQPKTPVLVRPRFHAGQSVLVIPTAVIAAGETCVHLVDTSYSAPALTPSVVTRPRLIDAAFTTPTLTTEGLC